MRVTGDRRGLDFPYARPHGSLALRRGSIKEKDCLSAEWGRKSAGWSTGDSPILRCYSGCWVKPLDVERPCHGREVERHRSAAHEHQILRTRLGKAIACGFRQHEIPVRYRG